MNNALSKKIGFFTFYVVMAILVEIFTFVTLGFGILPKYFLLDLAVILCIGGVIFIIPNVLAQYIVSEVLLFVQVLMCYMNYSLYSLYGDIFSIEMFNLATEAAKAIVTDFLSFTMLMLCLAVFVVTVLIGRVVYKRQKQYSVPVKKHFSLMMVMILFISQVVGVSAFTLQKQSILSQSDVATSEYITSDRLLMDSNILKAKSLSKLGTFGYYVNNINIVLSEGKDKELINAAVEYIDSGEIKTADGTDESNNLIVIMVESLEWFSLSEELTPNIWALMQDSVVANNFFSKNKTNIAEGLALMGSFPTGKILKQVAGSESDYDNFGFALPQVFKRNGYSTAYFHPYLSSFYNRALTYPQLGFDACYFNDEDYSQMTNVFSFGEWRYEKTFVDEHLEQMVPEQDQPFYTFFTTVNTHGPLDDNNKVEDRVAYKDTVLESEYWAEFLANHSDMSATQLNRTANYVASVHGLDVALKGIFDRLKALGIYDTTDIVLYGDHNMYYHNVTYDVKGVDKSDYSDYELNRVPLIIKTGKVVAGDEVERFCTATDIAPTILDLYGYNYNKNLYIGNSLFDTIDTYTVCGEEIEVPTFFSHTGGLYSRYMCTFNWETYYGIDSDMTDEAFLTEYKDAFKDSSMKLVQKYNYLNTIFTSGVYQKISVK